MLNTKNGRLYSLIAALCFAILGINNVVYILHYVITYNVEVQFSFIIYWIVMFGLAIALLAAKKIPSFCHTHGQLLLCAGRC